MTTIHEIAPDLFRLSIYVPDFDMQFNHFLVRDEEPLLFHAGFKGMFPALREASIMRLASSTVVAMGFSHKTGRPRSRAATVTSACRKLGVMTAEQS